MPGNSTTLVGLFDFSDYWDIVRMVSRVLELPEEEIHERLFKEAVDKGWNVSSAAREFGVIPHVYNGQMEEFYKKTDAFVFELLVGHLLAYAKEIDRRVIEAIEMHFSGKKDLQILALGDGIGSDSLRFAAMGYRVVYSEFEGWSSRLAISRFRRQRFGDRIEVLHRLESIPRSHFDVVICREVLEHVSDPPSVIEGIWEYLRKDGIAVITESFSRVDSAYPTHLAENRKYHGKTDLLFVKTGFRLLKCFPSRRPTVFQKTRKTDPSRFYSLRSSTRHIVGGAIRRVGRCLLKSVRL